MSIYYQRLTEGIINSNTSTYLTKCGKSRWAPFIMQKNWAHLAKELLPISGLAEEGNWVLGRR